jgi:hypothetical protein
MKTWADSKWFLRFLEIIPGLSAWIFILSPFILAFIVPVWVAIFILVYCLYFFFKSLNIARHLIFGFFRLRRNMKVDWLERLKKTTDISLLEKSLAETYRHNKTNYNYEDWLLVDNLHGDQTQVKDYRDIIHVVFIAVSVEQRDVLEPTIKAICESDYPSEKIMIVLAAEDRCKKITEKDILWLKKKYMSKFYDIRHYYHIIGPGEVIGKGPNITSGAKNFWKDYKGKLNPKNVLVTNLDADHIVHHEYFARLTYLYVLDPARDNKTYQPVALLFNNIWDSAFFCRIQAIGSSFWQIVEGMRPFRLRTFAAHTQNLNTLLATNFWATYTVVEDGHQYLLTYYTFNGDVQMVPLFLPVYQDAVYGKNMWESFKNQYKQRRRWAWGVSDFPYVVINNIRHKEIPLINRLLLTFRQFAGNFSWSTSSFVLAFAWIPLFFNTKFQDMVIAHNLIIYTSTILRIVWIGIIVNIWISMILLPPRPKKYKRWKNLEMIFQWVFAPITAIFVSSLPALESQTRLMIGKKLDVFWITPKTKDIDPNIFQKK